MIRTLVGLCSCILVAVTLQGCVMTSTPFQVQQVTSGEALVYLYRPESFISRGTHFSAVVNDDKIVGPLINNGHIPLHVKPGSLKVVLQKNSFPKSTYDTVVYDNIVAGKTYYLKANPALLGAYTLVKMDPTVGQNEVSLTSFYSPK
jgi:hypothetical protein